MMQKDDTLWKAILEDVFDDFLKYCFPSEIDQIDFERGFEYLDKELGQLFPPDQDEYKPKFVDKLVKVYTKSGDETWILVHIEVQGYRDKEFAKRMFQYYARIYDKFEKPIVGIAIFTDSDPEFGPSSFEQSIFGTQLSYRFNTIKVLDLSSNELQQSSNPFAFVLQVVKAALLAKKIDGDDLFNLKIGLARDLIARKIPKFKIRLLMNFLRYYVRFENKEFIDKFEIEIDSIAQTTTTMGLEEFLIDRAKKEGTIEGIIIGERKSNIKNAKILKELGVALSIIAKSTGLKEEEIINL